ncbi:hypothetical protein Q5H93_03280 [Hymenobacter sp. ASUV-10]|uniref:Glycosyltransferase RgtA/B/C/D-like domain-containing protein n=1 Tax=Hymenobacter aranciens TaxID=3063996 RepID=A0ABT9B635_9BACT|nr:hypothetical protein [Hymenobacter sp. ASUV-10]MDO7873741.1 hypothetical protein [Hymenobacter sp. ASUV-10]
MRRPDSLSKQPATARQTLALGIAAAVLLVAGSLGLLFGGTGYAVLAGFGRISYHENGFAQLPLALTPGRYQALLLALGGAAAGSLLALALLRPASALAALRAEWRRAGTRGRAWWRAQAGRSQLAAGLLLLAVLAARLWYLAQYPLSTDEVASYDYFVRGGPAVITSFYPIPNNHIFYNLLAWPLAELGLSPRLAMRLPSLLLGLLGTSFGSVLLARLLGWWRATLLLGLVGLAPLWVYYAANGRGYFVQFGLLQIGLFAIVELLRPASRYQRLSWLALLGSSVLGLYTVPSYAYPLVALGLGLAAGLLQQRRWPELPTLALAGAGIVLLAGLLYAPVGAVSGWGQLLGNRYVAARPDFWLHYRAALYEIGAELFGPSLRLSGPAWLALAALGGLAAGRLVLPGPRRTLALLVWLQLAVPLLLMAVQRVYAPARTLLHLTFFGYLLVLLLLTERLPTLRRAHQRIAQALALLAGLGLGAYRLQLDQVRLQASRRETQLFQQAYDWLQHQPDAHRIWLNAPLHELFFAHYARQQPGPLRVLHSGRRYPTAVHYDYLVVKNQPKHSAPFSYRLAYHDELVNIYASTR